MSQNDLILSHSGLVSTGEGRRRRRNPTGSVQDLRRDSATPTSAFRPIQQQRQQHQQQLQQQQQQHQQPPRLQQQRSQPTVSQMTKESTHGGLGHSLICLLVCLCHLLSCLLRTAPHCSTALICSLTRSFSPELMGSRVFIHDKNASISYSFNSLCSPCGIHQPCSRGK